MEKNSRREIRKRKGREIRWREAGTKKVKDMERVMAVSRPLSSCAAQPSSERVQTQGRQDLLVTSLPTIGRRLSEWNSSARPKVIENEIYSSELTAQIDKRNSLSHLDIVPTYLRPQRLRLIWKGPDHAMQLVRDGRVFLEC
jgi:hypothetical protein